MEYRCYLVKLTEESTGTVELGFLYKEEEEEAAYRKADKWNKYQSEIGGDCIAEVKKVLIQEIE